MGLDGSRRLAARSVLDAEVGEVKLCSVSP